MRKDKRLIIFQCSVIHTSLVGEALIASPTINNSKKLGKSDLNFIMLFYYKKNPLYLKASKITYYLSIELLVRVVYRSISKYNINNHRRNGYLIYWPKPLYHNWKSLHYYIPLYT